MFPIRRPEKGQSMVRMKPREAEIIVTEAFSMSDRSSFHTGGKAEYYAEPRDLEETRSVLELAYKRSLPVTIIGGGTHILVSEEGIPGIVLSLSWSLAYYFLIEKGKNPMQAIKASNDATYGSKWIMFFIMLVVGVLFGVAFGIFGAICSLINVGFITFVVMFVLIVLALSISMAVNASIWKQLKDNVE